MTTLVSVPKDGTELDVLAKRYRAAFDRVQSGREEWIDGTLELAAVMLEAKERPELSGNVAFSRWITRNQLEHFHPNDRAALIGFGKMKPAAARKLLEDHFGLAWRTIWEKRVKSPLRAPTSSGKSPQRVKSGSQKKKYVPSVMQEDNPPPPVRGSVTLKALTPEQVDPDFKGSSIEFAAKYGHVNLHTKQQIEHTKQQEALQAWLGAIADHERTGRLMLGTLAAVNPATLSEWMSKPSKAEKFRAWHESVQLACDAIRDTFCKFQA